MDRKIEQLRNVSLVAHVGSGKTSLAEAILFNGKAVNRLGKVDDGTSNMDFEPEEVKRNITINTSFHHCTWKKSYINLIDTPGDDNFLSDTVKTHVNNLIGKNDEIRYVFGDKVVVCSSP